MPNPARQTLPPEYETQLDALPAECRISTNAAATGIDKWLIITTTQLLQAVIALDTSGWHLEDITSLHVTEGFLLRYHFGRWDGPWRVCLYLIVNADNPAKPPTVPSIVQAVAGAEWHERETADFYGIIFTGNPNPTPLLLAADKKNFAPLRKETAALKSAFELLPDFTVVAGSKNHPLHQFLADLAIRQKQPYR